MTFKKDIKGLLISTDYLLGFFLFILAIGMIINLTDASNDKVINNLENDNLERFSSEVADYLIKEQGVPKNWEQLNNFNDIVPGLAIQNNFNETIVNTVSYNKFKIIGENYDLLIKKNMFNNRINSSIAIVPLNNYIPNLEIASNSYLNSNSSDSSNVIVINRTMKCDFYSDLALISISDKDFFKNIGDKGNLCNHDVLENINHQEDNWICKEFKIRRSEIGNNDYYLIFNDKAIDSNSYWILDNTKEISSERNPINTEIINLNSYFENEMINDSYLISYLHFNYPQNIDDFELVLVAIPKDLEIESLNIEYFKMQDSYFILKTWY